jgi:hypothetical protein
MNNTEKTLEFLEEQLGEYKMLVCCTNEIKKILLEGFDEELLGQRLRARESLLKKLVSSEKGYVPIRKFNDFPDDSEVKLRANEIIREIKTVLDRVASLDNEVVSLIQKRIHDITLDIEKVKEGKCFVDNLKKQTVNSSVLVDVCG